MNMFQIAIVLSRKYLSIVSSTRENCWTVNKIKKKKKLCLETLISWTKSVRKGADGGVWIENCILCL